MNRILIMIFAGGFLVSCGLLVGINNRPSNETTSQIIVPAWNGDHILCSENVSFARQSTDPLPVFRPDERLGFCARSMKYLALNRQYGDRTTFFGMSAEITGSFAALYAPLLRRVYTAETWRFAEQLNLAMDAKVDEVVAALDAGERGGAGFTNRIIAEEQAGVQDMLDALQFFDAEGYAQAIEDFNGTFNPTNTMLLAAINSNPFFAAYEASLAQIRVEVDGDVDFSILEHRLKIGAALDHLIINIAPTTQP